MAQAMSGLLNAGITPGKQFIALVDNWSRDTFKPHT
jgi:hypothetical protein